MRRNKNGTVPPTHNKKHGSGKTTKDRHEEVKEKNKQEMDNELRRFKEKLKVKRINGRKYFYYHLKTSFLKKEIYVGKFTENQDQLFEYMNKIAKKEFTVVLKELEKRSYLTSFLTEDEARILDGFRYLYITLLDRYSKSDLKRLEEAIYTKYVFGTTNIEGNTYSLRETDITLNEGLTVSGKSAREFFEIENYRRLKSYLNEVKRIKLTPEFIKRIHKFLLKNIDDESAGEFRKIDAGIRGTDFVPMPHIIIEEEVDKLCKWYNEQKRKAYPLELISEFHVRFEQIHPFKDGNGRVGRELMRLQLREFQFPTVFIGPENREAYLKSLDQCANGNYAAFAKFMHQAVLKEFRELFRLLFRDIQSLFSQIKGSKKFKKAEKHFQDQILSTIQKIGETEHTVEKFF